MKKQQKEHNTYIQISQHHHILDRYNSSTKKTKHKVLIGAITKIIKLDETGITVSFANNLKASANACKEPRYRQH